MADFNSSLPVRTENAGDIIAKIADATVPSQQLKVESDGSINVNAAFSPGTEVTITDGTDSLAINTDGSLNATVNATDLDIRNLVFATDKADVSGSEVSLSSTTLAALESVTVQNGAGASAVNIQDGGNSITVDGTVELGSTTLAALESTTVQNGSGAAAVNIQDGGNSITVDGSVTVSSTDLDIRNLVFASDKVDVSGSNVTATVSATDLDIRNLSATQDNIRISDGTDNLEINSDGSINVRINKVNGATSVSDYNTATSIASGASNTHTYTSTGNFYLEQIEAAASGKLKIEIRLNGVTKFVKFNSTANPNISTKIEQPILATTGQTVTVIRTNNDNQTQDVYSTIIGFNL